MKPKTLGLLAAVVLILGAFIWFVERDLPGTEERAERAKQVLGGVEASDVETVTIHLGDDSVHLDRVGKEGAEGASWRLTSPVDMPADDTAVEHLLRTLTRLEKQTSVEDPDRADLGLEPPEATVTVRSSGREQTLRVGVDVPVTGGRVVALQGSEEVWVTEDALWDAITRDSESWRSKRAVPFSASEIVRLRLSGDGLEIPVEIVRESSEASDTAGRFRLTAPVDDVADRQTVQDLTSRLVTLRIEDFLDDPGEAPEDLDLDSPRFVVELFADPASEAEPHVLEMIAPVADSEELWLARTGGRLVETRAPELVELLDRPADAWRSRLLTDLQIFELERVRVRQAGADEMVLARVEGDWTRDGEALPYAPVRELFFQITGTRAVDVQAGDATRVPEVSADPRLVFELEPNVEDLSRETISVYPGEDSGGVVWVEPRGALLRVEANAMESLVAAVEGVRQAEPLDETEQGEGGVGEG